MKRLAWKFAGIGLVHLMLVSQLAAADLETVLAAIDKVGMRLRNMRAEIEQKKWTDILAEYDQGEKGLFAYLKEDEKVYLRKEIREPNSNLLVIKDNTALFYQPGIKQAQRYELGKHGDKAEFLVLGFGTERRALEETYELKLLGEETVDGVKTYKLELKPKSDRVAAFFVRIVLWIDSENWIPIQQKLVEPTQDHLLVKFSSIELNTTLKESDFDLKLPKDVEVIQN